MRKNVSRKIVMLLIVCFVVSLMAVACSRQEQDSSPAGTKSTDATKEAGKTDEPVVAEEPVTIRWMTYNAPTADFLIGKNSEAELLLEEKFNVNIEVVQANIHVQEPRQLDLLIASGDIPDIIYSKFDWYSYIDNEVCRPITKEMLAQNMPKWMRQVEETLGDDPYKYIVYKDKIWYVPNISDDKGYKGSGYIAKIRKDWLDRLGMNIPDTMDELYNVMYAFRHNDPDGNGEKDTYGMHLEDMWPMFQEGAYGFNRLAFVPDENGKIQCLDISDNAKRCIKELNRWYKDGIYVTSNDGIDAVVAFANGVIGWKYGAAAWSFVNDETLNPDNFTAQLLKNSPDAELANVGYIAGPDGKRGVYVGYMPKPGPSATTPLFGKNASDAVVTKFMQIMESIFTDNELFIRLYFGEKDKDYTYSEKGVIVPNPDLTIEQTIKRGLGTHFTMIPKTYDNWTKIYYTDLALSEYDFLREFYKNNKVDDYYYGINFFSLEECGSFTKNATALRAMRQEWHNKFITGEKDIDAEWDIFVKEFKEAGVQTIIDEMQVLYDKYNK